ncbi:MAG: cation:proton antiporter [Deltaproteobacteria bacterium]|nr:cation:proton antiporter [Deltaproteobacteria bacterium]
MSPSIAIGIIGIVILLGFVGEMFFSFTKIPSILFLMLAGLMLGPIYHIFNQQLFIDFAPYLSTLVLILIMFSGGLELNFITVFKSSIYSMFLIIIGLFLSIALVGGFFYIMGGGDLMQSLMLGVIVSCSSSTVIMPLLSNISVSDKNKTIIAIESTFNDALAIIILIVLINFAKNSSINVNYLSTAGGLLYSFGISSVIAIAFGIIWFILLRYISKTKYAYSITFGGMLILYLIMHFVKGNGAIAILVFGIVMGNEELLNKLKINLFKMSLKDSSIKQFNYEFSFLIRTLFFVFLGVVVELSHITWEFTDRLFIIIVMIIIGRYISSSATFYLENLKKSSRERLPKREKYFLWSMIGRALATAIMAYMPLNAGIAGTQDFPEYAFLVIIITNILLTGGVYFYSRYAKNETAKTENAQQES